MVLPTIPKIQLRRTTAALWTSTNVILGPAEPGVETDTGKFKIGDGVTPWVLLPYFGDEEEFLNMVRDLTPTGGPFQFIGGDVVSVDTLLSAVLASIAILEGLVKDKIDFNTGGGGANLDGVPFIVMYVWDGDNYILANNGTIIPTNCVRTFTGPVDPVDAGFSMIVGDQWLRVGGDDG